MNKLKYILPVTIFFCLLAVGAAAQDTIILDKIVAKVGGEVIFHSDVEEQMAMMRERRATPGPKEQEELDFKAGNIEFKRYYNSLRELRSYSFFDANWNHSFSQRILAGANTSCNQ